MRIYSTTKNKKTITLSKKEWQDIGKKAGWNKKNRYTGEYIYFDDQLEFKGVKNTFNVDYTGRWTLMDDSDYSPEGYGSAHYHLYNEPDDEDLTIIEYNSDNDFIRDENKIKQEDPSLYEKILKVCRERSELDEKYLKED